MEFKARKARSVFFTGLVSATVIAAGCGRDQGEPAKFAQTSVRSTFSSVRPAALIGANSVATRACAADKINESEPAALVTVAQASSLSIVGWALDDAAGTVPAEVFVELASDKGGGPFYAAAARLTKRPDVAKAHGNAAFENSGYDLAADLAGVPLGIYSVRVVQPVAAGVLTCDTNRKVEIR